MQAIPAKNFGQALQQVKHHWFPCIIVSGNDQYVKVAELKVSSLQS